MQFLADVRLVCEDCGGKRFKREVLDVKYNEKSIFDILELSVDEAIMFFGETKDISPRLQPLSDVGLGYMNLGAITPYIKRRRSTARQIGVLGQGQKCHISAVYFRRTIDGFALQRHQQIVGIVQRLSRGRAHGGSSRTQLTLSNVPIG